MTDSKFLYRKVYDDLVFKIKTGLLKSNDKLKSDTELMEEYNVSAITIKKALTLLAENGLIERVKGTGSFVCETNSKMIGVILEDLSPAYGLKLLHTLDLCAREKNIKLVFRFSYSNRELENSELKFLINLGVSGIIVMPTRGNHYNTDLVKIIFDDFPIVLLDRGLDGMPVQTVMSDHKKATEMLVDYVAQNGKKHIGYITSNDFQTSSVKDRFDGFYYTLDKYKLPHLPHLPINFDHGHTNEMNVDVINEIAKYIKDHNYDAIICAEYAFIPHLVKAIKLANIKEDICICSVDQDEMSSYDFAHIKQDEELLARTAFDCLLSRINDNNHSKITHKIEPILNATI